MDNKQWNALGTQGRQKLLRSAELSLALAQLRYSSLSKSQRSKLEKQGKGWFEAKEPIKTRKGIEHKAPEHRRVAIRKEAGRALNKPMEQKEPIASKKPVEKSKLAHGGRKESPKDYLLKTPLPLDPTFEKSETERMMDERKREEGTYEDIVVPYDTGDVGEMRQEAGIAEAFRKMPEDWFSADRQKEWEKHEAEGYEGNQPKPYSYYTKTYPHTMEWISKHFRKVTSAKELEEAVSFYFGNDWKQFEEFLQEKQEEIATQLFEKEQKAQERKKQLESRYFTTKFRDIDDRNKTECIERFPAQKAHPFTHRGINLFAHKDGKEWKATEVTTGLDIVRAHQFKGKWQNNSKDEIIQTAKEFIDEKTPEKVSELIKYAADTISRTSPCSQVSG